MEALAVSHLPNLRETEFDILAECVLFLNQQKSENRSTLTGFRPGGDLNLVRP